MKIYLHKNADKINSHICEEAEEPMPFPTVRFWDGDRASGFNIYSANKRCMKLLEEEGTYIAMEGRQTILSSHS